MAMSLEQKINRQLGDGSLTSSFQPGHDGEMSPYAQARVAAFYSQAAQRQDYFTAYSQDSSSPTA